MLRGTGLGSLLGILPGGGAVLASFASYTLEKKVAKDPSRFGKGAIEGVAGPESANNAAAQTSFIPLLTLGLPSNAIMALMMGAMIIQGIQPGSAVMTKRPGPVLGHGRQHVDRQPDAAGDQSAADRHLGAAAVGAVPAALSGDPAVLRHRHLQHQHQHRAAGADARRSRLFGYILLRFGCEPAPLVLGFILGPLMEENLRRSLVHLARRSDGLPRAADLGDPAGMTVAVIALIVLPQFRKTREEAFQE